MSRDEIRLSYIWKDLSQPMKIKLSEILAEINNENCQIGSPLYAYQTYVYMEALSGGLFGVTKVVDSLKSKENKLRLAAEPLVKLLQSDYDSHTTVLVENDFVTLRRDDIGLPFDNDCEDKLLF